MSRTPPSCRLSAPRSSGASKTAAGDAADPPSHVSEAPLITPVFAQTMRHPGRRLRNGVIGKAMASPPRGDPSCLVDEMPLTHHARSTMACRRTPSRTLAI